MYIYIFCFFLHFIFPLLLVFVFFILLLMTAATLLLDPDIRNWVLFPIFVIVLLVGVLRHYVTILMHSPKTEELTERSNGNITAYANQILNEKGTLDTQPFLIRANRMIDKTLKKEFIKPDPSDVLNTSVTMGMMKSQMMMMANNIGLMILIGSFFSGFVVAQLPFSVPLRLREMMQRGISIDDLECSYVTSLSFYFLVLSGVSGLLQLLVGEDKEMTMVATNSMVGLQQNNFTTTPEYDKIWAQKTKELKNAIPLHKYLFKSSPELLLARLKE